MLRFVLLFLIALFCFAQSENDDEIIKKIEKLLNEGKCDEVLHILKEVKAKGTDIFSHPKYQGITKVLLEYAMMMPQDKRIKFLELYLELFPENPYADWMYARLFTDYNASKNQDKAKIYEQKLLTKENKSYKTYFQMGRMYLENNLNLEKAREFLEKSIEMYKREELKTTGDKKSDEVARLRKESEISVFRSYLAYAYYRCGVQDAKENIFIQEEVDDTVHFTEVTKDVGLSGIGGGRVAVADFDNDGFEDFLSHGALFKNNSAKSFTKVDKEILPEGISCNGSLFADFDNDGWLDIVFVGHPKVRIFRNSGKGKFEEKTQQAGFIDTPSPPEGCGIADFDNDGLLDIYIACYETPQKLAEGNRDFIYRNEGDFKFKDMTVESGIGTELKLCGRGVNCGDYNDDGKIDIYVSNYRLQPNLLWENQGGFKFVEVSKEKGVKGVEVDKWWGHTIGSVWGDFDNDMDLDLICANLAHPRYIQFSNMTQVLLNGGLKNDYKFTDIFKESGIEYEETHSDVSMVDYDNDGDLDVYITSVYAERPSFLYQNVGGHKFKKATWKSGTLVFNGWGHAWFDYDKDGDMDLLVCANGVRLFRNELNPSKNGGNYLQIKLCGTKSNSLGIGARIFVTQMDKKQMREIYCGRGTTSGDSFIAHFGFGNVNEPVDVEVKWSSGRVSKMQKVKLNQRIEVRE